MFMRLVPKSAAPEAPATAPGHERTGGSAWRKRCKIIQRISSSDHTTNEENPWQAARFPQLTLVSTKPIV